MSSEEALSITEMPQVVNRYVTRRKSLDNLLKNKYITYTEEELTKMNNQKKDEILQLDETNKKLKEELTKLVEKLNKLIRSNSEVLFHDPEKDSDKLVNLEKIYYLRKHDQSLSIKHNKTFKQQYNALQIKKKELGTTEDFSKKIVEQKNSIQKLRIENSELNKQIQEKQFENVKQTRELENSKFIAKLENNVQNYTQKVNDSSLTRFIYFDKMENKKKSVEKLKEQFKSLNEYVDKNKKKINESNKADIIMAKINSEMDILKKDLDKTVDEIIENCFNEKISMLENMNNTEMNNKNILNKNSSQQNLISNAKIKLRPIKKINRSRSLLFNISIDDNNEPYKNINNIKTLKNVDTTRSIKKKNLSVFSKFKVLRTNNISALKLGKSSSFNPKKNVSTFITKEVIDFGKKTMEEQELDKEIEKIDVNDYQQLIDLKGNYVSTNDRLERDIKEKKRICYNRINQLNICVANNLIKLNKIKKTNEIMKKELEEFEQKYLEKIQKKKD